METILLIPLLLIGLCLAVPVIEAIIAYGRVALWYACDALVTVAGEIRGSADSAVYRVHRKMKKREFLDWLEAKIGSGRPNGSINHQILEAKRQTAVLRRLVEEEVPKAIERCLTMHRLAASVAGASYMYEIAFEPECHGLRERVVDLVEASVDLIEGYPLLLDDAALMQNVLVLRMRMLPTCRNCPYLDHAVAQAPPLCPSAEMAGIRPPKC